MIVTFESLALRFQQAFPTPSGEPLEMVCAPGRANVIGEHTDYQEGFVTPFALEERCYLVYRRTADTKVRAYAADLDEWCDVDVVEMAKKRSTDQDWGSRVDDFETQFIRYVAGPMEWLKTEALDGDEYRGCDVFITSNVPLGGGVSSSSALSVASTCAARQLYQDLDWKGDATMLRAACEAEWHYSGVRGGIMDQFTSLNGRQGGALVLDCRTQRIREFMPLPEGEKLGFLIINTNVKHSLVDSPYAKRRASCERVASVAATQFPDLKITHLRDLSDLGKDRGLGILRQLTGLVDEDDMKRATHGVLENCRVMTAVELAKQKDWPGFGKLLDEAHASLADLYEVSCPELDAACKGARESDQCLGARLMGGGFGGCVIALCTDVLAVKDYVLPRYKELTGIDASAFVAKPGPGAQLLVDGTFVPVFDLPYFCNSATSS